ncbi:MAG: hypothetical protein HYZ81_25575 [Nitrospinae bacterium]|nr:hypothetical protein [Nitrospinota bacterium]
MAKDQGQVRRVLQILSPEDQETLAILHDPPLMEELLRRQDTLREVKVAGLTGGVTGALADADLPRQGLQSPQMFPAAIDELAALPPPARMTLLRIHLPQLVAAPRQGFALTQLFRGLWVSICTVDHIDYRLVYEIDPQDALVTMLMVGTWKSLEERLNRTT